MYSDCIPIFFSTDNNYAMPTYVALFSLLINYKGERNLNVYVLTSKDFRDEYVDLLHSLSEKFIFAEIKLINMEDSYSSVKINNSHITTPTMYRLLIPRIGSQLSIRKCIYLDSDTVIDGDISELFNIDIEDYCMGGVSNIPTSESIAKTDKDTSFRYSQYVNAGVLLFNSREIIKRGLDIKLQESGYYSFPDNDQDAINNVFCGAIKLLPDRFNVRKIHYLTDNQKNGLFIGSELIHSLEKPLVFHFVSNSKPWQYKSDIMSSYWWKYVDMLDDIVKEKYINPFLASNRLPFVKRAKETIKALTVSLGLYEPVFFTKKHLRRLFNK